jgi:ADP-heptose:LPS heptosyltransferase
MNQFATPSTPEPDIRKIAVLRANGLGDFMFILPALDALRAAYPEAEITLLGTDLHLELLRGRPGPIDQIVVVPPSHGVRDQPGIEENEVELDRFFEAMARERFDLAVQMHGGGRNSNPFVLRLGARLTVGLKTHDAPRLDRWVPYVYFQPEIIRYLEVVALVGARPTRLEPYLQVTEKDLAETYQLLPDKSQPLVALHPGASDFRRRWSPEKFARVGDELARSGARVVVTGNAPERDLADQVVAAMQTTAQNLAGQLSLGGLAGLLSRCRVVVSNDTGPRHLADAVGAATVAIYWCGNLINCGPLSRTRHRPFAAWRLDCSVCGASCIHNRCSHEVSFVDDVAIEEVANAAIDLFTSPFPAFQSTRSEFSSAQAPRSSGGA